MKQNRIVDCGDYFEMFLCNRLGVEIAKTKISPEDVEKVKDLWWNYHVSSGYIVNSKVGALHIFLLGGKMEGMLADHMNRQRLDNRQENLRYVTHSESVLNSTHNPKQRGVPLEVGKPTFFDFRDLYCSISDVIYRFLTQAEQSIYFRLFRLSYGKGETSIRIGFEQLAKECNLSMSTLKRAVRSLKKRKLVYIEWEQHKNSLFDVYVPSAALKGSENGLREPLIDVHKEELENGSYAIAPIQ